MGLVMARGMGVRVGNSGCLIICSYGDYVICRGIGDLARAGGFMSAVVVAGFGLTWHSGTPCD